MPIRTKPWSEVTLQDVEDLIDREIREDATIEFKRQLNFSTDDEKREFLKDVSAMANAVGGTIVFGAEEGTGEQRGQIVRIRGQAVAPDDLELRITNILRDNLDERLGGVLFKALPTAVAGEYVLVLRIPASPLAPHRITYREKPQFYIRGNVSTNPMNTREIREMVLQRESAVDRAQHLVEDRTRILQAAGLRRNDTLHFNKLPFQNPDQVVLHVIPLFPAAGGWQLGPERERRLMSVRPLGAREPFDRPFYTAEGMYSRFHERRHVLFLRGGGVEFQRYDVLDRARPEGAAPFLQAWRIETDILKALAECAALTEDGLLPLPVLISVRLLDVEGTLLKGFPDDWMNGEHPQTDSDVFLTPVVIHGWGQFAEEQVRQVFDEMWQAWHLPACANYHPDGRHHEYDEGGRIIQQHTHRPDGREGE